MAGDVLKEFLVSLGWKNDEASYRRFNDTIEQSTKGILVFGAGIEGAMLSLYHFLDKAAAGFEKLSYKASLAGTTTQSIRDIGFAASQTGSSFDEAVAAVEAFSAKLRETGGGQEAMLKRFHVQTRETNGELRDSVILMREYDAALKKEFPGGSGSLGYATRLQFEKDSGLPETFARSLNNPELQKWIDDSKKRAEAFGLNDPKNVENAKNFELAIRGLKNEIDDLGL